MLFRKKKNKRIETVDVFEMTQRIESINKQFESLNRDLFTSFEQQKKLVKR